MEAGWGKLAVQEALTGKHCQLSQAAWGSQAVKAGGKTSKAGKAPGRLSQQLGHCCPLVATSAATSCLDFRKQFSAACTCLSFPVGDRHAHLLQGLHQGLIGLNTDLDFSPCCLIRCTRQLRLCLLQVGPGCL